MEIDNTKKCYVMIYSGYFGPEDLPLAVFGNREGAEEFIASAPTRTYCRDMSTLYWTYCKNLSDIFNRDGKDLILCQASREEFGAKVRSFAISLYKRYPDKTFVLEERNPGYRIVEVDYFV